MGQLTREQYEALDGQKIRTERGTITFKRWTKEKPEIIKNVETGEETPIVYVLDRVYINIFHRTKYGEVVKSSLGIIEVVEFSWGKYMISFRVEKISDYLIEALYSFFRKIGVEE